MPIFCNKSNLQAGLRGLFRKLREKIGKPLLFRLTSGHRDIGFSEVGVTRLSANFNGWVPQASASFASLLLDQFLVSSRKSKGESSRAIEPAASSSSIKAN